jgi:hypothetical protein
MRKDGRTTRYDGASSRSSQFCEREQGLKLYKVQSINCHLKREDARPTAAALGLKPPVIQR